jgi:hypothetical protein
VSSGQESSATTGGQSGTPSASFRAGVITCETLDDVLELFYSDKTSAISVLNDGTLATWVWGTIGDKDLAGDLRGLAAEFTNDPEIQGILAITRLDPQREAGTYRGLPFETTALVSYLSDALKQDMRDRLSLVLSCCSNGLLSRHSDLRLQPDKGNVFRLWEQRSQVLEDIVRTADVVSSDEFTQLMERASALLLHDLLLPPANLVSAADATGAIRGVWWLNRLISLWIAPGSRELSGSFLGTLQLLLPHADTYAKSVRQRGAVLRNSARVRHEFDLIRSLFATLRQEQASIAGESVISTGQFFFELPITTCPRSGQPLDSPEVRQAVLDSLEGIVLVASRQLANGNSLGVAEAAEKMKMAPRPNPNDVTAWELLLRNDFDLEHFVPTTEPGRTLDSQAADAFSVRCQRLLEVGLPIITQAQLTNHPLTAAVEDDIRAIADRFTFRADTEDDATEQLALRELEDALDGAQSLEEEEAALASFGKVAPVKGDVPGNFQSSIAAFFVAEEERERRSPQIAGFGLVMQHVGKPVLAMRSDRVQLAGIPNLEQLEQLVLAGSDKYPVWFARYGDGTVTAWGSGVHGLTGNGIDRGEVSQPTTILQDVVSIAARSNHALALHRDGSVSTWGANQRGQLGLGHRVGSNTPVKIRGLNGVKRIAAGAGFSLALDERGGLYVWGDNRNGQLGLRFRRYPRVEPTMVRGLPAGVDIAAGWEHALLIDDRWRLWTWGLGTPITAENDRVGRVIGTPELVSHVDDVRLVAAGAGTTVALRGARRLISWGLDCNPYGSPRGRQNHRSVGVDIRHVACGLRHVVFVDTDGGAWAFGRNGFAQTSGTTPCVTEPQPLPLRNRAVWVATGPSSTLIAEQGMAL